MCCFARVRMAACAACAILYDRTLKCWGRGDNGRLGHDSLTSVGAVQGDMASLTFSYVGHAKTVKSIISGCTHTCVELNDGSLKCFGEG